MDNPAERIDGFYMVLIERLKAGDTGQPQGGGQPAWQTFEDAYKAQKDAIAARFNADFRFAALEVAALVESKGGRKKMKGMTAGFAGSRAAEDLSYAKLKAQAMYIGGRAGEIEGTQEEKDKSHERAAQGAAAYLSYRQLLDFDPAQLAVPTDRYAPGAAGSAPKKARTAEVDALGPLNDAGHLGRLSNYTKSGAGPERYDQKLLDALGSDVDAVRATLDALGTKSRGGPFATRELPRNRQLAGSFVANSYLVAGGALRAQFFLLQVSYLLDRMSYLLDGKFRTNQVAQVLPVAQAAVAAIPIMQALAGSYITDLEALAADLPGFTKVDGAAGLAKSLGNINRTLANAQGKLNAAAQNRPEAIVNALRFTSG